MKTFGSCQTCSRLSWATWAGRWRVYWGESETAAVAYFFSSTHNPETQMKMFSAQGKLTKTDLHPGEIYPESFSTDLFQCLWSVFFSWKLIAHCVTFWAPYNNILESFGVHRLAARFWSPLQFCSVNFRNRLDMGSASHTSTSAITRQSTFRSHGEVWLQLKHGANVN